MTYVKRWKNWRMLCSFSNLSVTSPTSQLILLPFRRCTYVTAHFPTLPLLHLRHSSFSNPSFTSPTSQALHLIHLASRPCISAFFILFILIFSNIKDLQLYVCLFEEAHLSQFLLLLYILIFYSKPKMFVLFQ